MSPESSGRDITFDLSPDGTRIVFPGIGKGVRDLYLLNLKTRKVTRLTETESWETDPMFSPDGRSVVYSAWADPKQKDHYWHLYLLDLETRQTRQLTHGQVGDSAPQFTPDGKYIVFDRATRLRNYSMGGKVWSDGNVCAIETKQKNPKVIDLPLSILHAGISKDGKVLMSGAFVSEGSYPADQYVLIDLLASLKNGKLKIIQVLSSPHKNLRWLGSSVWSPNGKYIAFDAGESEIWLAQSGLQNAQQLTDLHSSVKCPRFAPDNATIYFLNLETDLVSMKSGIWKVNRNNKVCVQVADYKLFDNPLGWRPKK